LVTTATDASGSARFHVQWGVENAIGTVEIRALPKNVDHKHDDHQEEAASHKRARYRARKRRQRDADYRAARQKQLNNSSREDLVESLPEGGSGT
jgi:hypothetical protein